MAWLSMARIAALCLACCCFAARASAEHAPPPPIVLSAPPAPELPALEYARRPFELTAELLLGFPNCTPGSVDNQRCDGISAGPGFGATALWRPSPFFAFGGTVNALGFAFQPSASSGLRQASAGGHFYGLLGRVYFLDHGLVEPYFELGLGGGGLGTSAREPDVEYDESASGIAVHTGGALEFYLSRHVRLGPAFDWTTFSVQRVRRCGASRCVDLDEGSYGHGTGFSSVSVRLSILLGPAL